MSREPTRKAAKPPKRWRFPHPPPAGTSIFKPRGSTPATAWTIQYRTTPNSPRKYEYPSADPTITLRRALEIAAAIQQAHVDPTAGRYANAARKPLAEHLAEFHAHLIAKGSTPKHADLTRDRVARVLVGAKAVRVDDLQPSTVLAAIVGLTDSRNVAGPVDGSASRCPCGRVNRREDVQFCPGCLKRRTRGQPHGDELAGRKAGAVSLTTRNHYLTAAKAFTRWLAGAEKRMRDDPLAGLSRWNAKTGTRRMRQDFGDAGAAKLVDAARTGPTVAGMSGADRAWLIETALETGFRANELGTLVNTPEIFRLAGAVPSIVVKAGYSKRRREDHQPIRPEFADRLAEFLRTRPAGEPVWALPPDKSAELIRADLRRAGIPEVDAGGRVADFHALRHTFVCRLVRSGLHPAECQALARHSTITLTMDLYTHLKLADTGAAINRMRPLGATDGPPPIVQPVVQPADAPARIPGGPECR